MTSNAIEAFRQLVDRFTVKDIMTPKSRLVFAQDVGAAPAVSAANPDFSVIPITNGDELAAYCERDAKSARTIGVSDLLSDGMTLLDTVDILEQHGFAFVLTHRRIDGYVHYSDLNHQMVKWTFYVMLEAVERMAIENLRFSDERAYLQERMSADRFARIEGLYKRAGDNGRSLMTCLNFADILRLAVSDCVFHLDESSIGTMKDVRDWAAHVLYDLDSETAVRNLATVKQESLRLLGRGRAEGACASA